MIGMNVDWKHAWYANYLCYQHSNENTGDAYVLVLEQPKCNLSFGGEKHDVQLWKNSL